MLITILAMINPHLTSPAISFAQAHSWVETRSSFRLIPRWTRLRQHQFAKHGVSFRLAKPVFRDPLALTIFDEEHSEDR